MTSRADLDQVGLWTKTSSDQKKISELLSKITHFSKKRYLLFTRDSRFGTLYRWGPGLQPAPLNSPIDDNDDLNLNTTCGLT